MDLASSAPGPSAELRPRHYRDYLSWALELLPLAIIGATAAYLARTYAAAPAIIPTHFDASGTPDAYSAKTVGIYFIAVWIQLVLEVILTAVALLIVGARQLPGAAEARLRRLLIRFLFVLKVGVIALLGVLGAGIAFAQATPGVSLRLGWLVGLPFAVAAVVLVGSLVLTLRVARARAAGSGAAPTDRLSDRYWKLGLFYVNPKDPSIFVDRRFGVGYDLNWGNPLSWVVLAGTLALPLIILAVVGLSGSLR